MLAESFTLQLCDIILVKIHQLKHNISHFKHFQFQLNTFIVDFTMAVTAVLKKKWCVFQDNNTKYFHYPLLLPYPSTRWGGGIAARPLVKFFSFSCDSLHLFHFWWCEKSLSPFSSTRDWQPIQGVPYPLSYDRWDRLQPPSMNPNWYLRKWMGGWIYATITMQV